MTDLTPGRPVRGSRSGRPIMALLDLLGRRWVLRILWELNKGPLSFRALRANCDQASPSVLNHRLRELRNAGFVNLTDDGYGLTAAGRDLVRAFAPLNRVASQWQERYGATATTAHFE